MKRLETGIGIIVSQLSCGGAERQTALLVEHLARRHGIHPWVYSMSPHLDPFGDAILRSGSTLVHWQRARSYEFSRCLAMRREVRWRRPSLVHAVNYNATAYAYLALLGRRRIPLLPSIRSTEITPNPLKALLFRLALRSSPRVLANSHSGADFLERRFNVPRHRLVVIPNGLELERCRPERCPREVRRELGIAPQSPVVGYVGKMTWAKDIPFLLRIAQQVLDQRPDAVLLLVGPGLTTQGMNLTSHNGSRRAIALGMRHDVYDLMGAMDVLLLTSRTEGCPNVVLEAMALGVAVVATRVGDCGRIIEHGVDGLLFRHEAEKEGTRLVLSLLANPQQRREMGERARRKVRENYSAQRMVDRTLEVYRELLGMSPREDSR